MQHPLDGARLKVVRAQEHLDNLASEIAAFLKRNVNYIESEIHENKSLRLTPKFPEAPPLRLSAIIGDCVSNARAALDYIAWQLILKYSKVTVVPPPIGKHKPYFPIADNPGRLQGYLNGRDGLVQTFSVPANVVGEIKVVQPYNAGYESLWRLYLLVNEDKHRLPILTIGEVPTVFTLKRGDTIIASGIKATNLITMRPPDMPISVWEDVHVEAHYSSYIALGDVTMPREPVQRTLEQIVKTVANVVPRFDQFFV